MPRNRTAATFAVLAVAALAPAAAARARSPVAPLAVAAATPSALTPAEFRRAYALPTRGAHRTIAVISIFNAPAVAVDLAAYGHHFHIPRCTIANRCLRILNQNGARAPLPGPDPTGGTWVTEASLGTQVARGVCRTCRIVLVEADTTTKASVSAAVDAAAGAGAQIIVTTFAPLEDIGDGGYAPAYSHRRSIVVAATGDTGFTGDAFFPSSLPGVIAVGGTRLRLGPHRRYGSETAWPQTASGCSTFTPSPPWQVRFGLCGGQRSVADIAAAAEPGALVHITGIGQPGGPWYDVGGTSMSAPLVAGMIGLAGGGGSAALPRLYHRARTNPGVFHDVRRGANGTACVPRALCHARRGFDGPTGLGTPHGLGAFSPRSPRTRRG